MKSNDYLLAYWLQRRIYIFFKLNISSLLITEVIQRDLRNSMTII